MADRERSRSRERSFPEEDGTKLYVGNLSYQTTNEDLESTFSKYGSVNSAQVISDRDTGRSRGFGFVVFANKDDADAAIDALNGQDLQGRNISVNVARKRGDGPPPRRGGFGDRNGGGYGGRGGFGDRNGGGYGGRGGGYRGDREDRGGRYERDDRRGRDSGDRGRW